MILIKSFYVPTTQGIDVISVGHEVRRVVQEAAAKEGWVTLFSPLPGAGFALGPVKEAKLPSLRCQGTLVVPFNAGRLVIDPWQEIYLVEEETSGRRREFMVQLFTEVKQDKQA